MKTSMISFIALIARCLRKLLLPMMLWGLLDTMLLQVVATGGRINLFKGESGSSSNYKGIKQLFSFESIHKAHTPCILLPTSAIWPNKDFEQLSHTLCNDYKGRLHALWEKPIENSTSPFRTSNPRWQSKGVWDNIYFDTYVTWEHVRSREVKIFPLVSRNKLPTHWKMRSCQTTSSNTARPCLDSNPRCFSKGVWGTLYYSTYGTPVLKSRLCLQSKPSTDYSCNSSQKIQAIISWHYQRPVIFKRGCRSIQDPNSHFNDTTTEHSHDIPNVKSLSTQCFWWIFNQRIQSSNCSELLPTTISVQYSDGSRFFSNSNMIFGAIVFSVKSPVRNFCPVSLLRFHMIQNWFFKPVLSKDLSELGTFLYPIFKYDGALNRQSWYFQMTRT